MNKNRTLFRVNTTLSQKYKSWRGGGKPSRVVLRGMSECLFNNGVVLANRSKGPQATILEFSSCQIKEVK